MRISATDNLYFMENISEDEFQAVGEVVTFDGFLKVYKESFDEEVEQEDATGLPKMEVGEVLQREEIERGSYKQPTRTKILIIKDLSLRLWTLKH